MPAVFYLIYWLTQKDETLSVSHIATDEFVTVTISQHGKRAEAAAREIFNRLPRVPDSPPAPVLARHAPRTDEPTTTL